METKTKTIDLLRGLFRRFPKEIVDKIWRKLVNNAAVATKFGDKIEELLDQTYSRGVHEFVSDLGSNLMYMLFSDLLAANVIPPNVLSPYTLENLRSGSSLSTYQQHAAAMKEAKERLLDIVELTGLDILLSLRYPTLLYIAKLLLDTNAESADALANDICDSILYEGLLAVLKVTTTQQVKDLCGALNLSYTGTKYDLLDGILRTVFRDNEDDDDQATVKDSHEGEPLAKKARLL